MKDINSADSNKLTPNSSTTSKMSATDQSVVESALVKHENGSGIAPETPALARLYAVTKIVFLFGVFFAGSFAIALTAIRNNQIQKLPPLSNPNTPNNIVTSRVTVTPDNQGDRAKTKPYSMADKIISLVTFGYVTGLPQDRSIKVSKHNLTGLQIGRHWGKENSFEPVANLSAPPPLSSQPLQTVSPLQLPPSSFKILPNSLPEALNPTDSQTPLALSKNKPGNSELSSQANVAEAPKDILGKTLTTGTQAKASLVNAAVFSGSSTTSSNPRFVVKLEESLKSSSGKVAFSSDTTLVAVVRPLSSKGVAELEAVSIVVDGKEYDLPAGSITLLDRDGSSLAGLKYGDEETETSNPEQEDSKNPKQTSNSSPTPKPDAPNSSEIDPSDAASTAPVPDQTKPGNREAIENVMRQSQFYYIPQGTALKLVVNKTIKL